MERSWAVSEGWHFMTAPGIAPCIVYIRERDERLRPDGWGEIPLGASCIPVENPLQTEVDLLAKALDQAVTLECFSHLTPINGYLYNDNYGEDHHDSPELAAYLQTKDPK